MRKQRGVTLLEMMIAGSLLLMVALFTMRTLGQARILRGNAAMQHTMLLLAQEELDRLRMLSVSDMAAGIEEIRHDNWPEKVKATVTIAEREDGTWLLDVVVGRPTIEGLQPVRLTTIRQGGRS